MKQVLFVASFFLLFNQTQIRSQVIWEKLQNPVWPDSATIYDFKIVSDSLWLTATLDFGLLSSSNQGNSWNRIFYQEDYVYYILFNSSNEIFIACLDNKYKSTDGGVSWEIISEGIIDWDLVLIQISHNDELFGLFKQGYNNFLLAKFDNNIDDWKVVKNFTIDVPYVTDLLIDKYEDIYLSAFVSVAPYYQGYTYRFVDSYNNGYPIFSSTSRLACNDAGYVFFGNQKMYRSRDRGMNIEEINNGISNLGIASIKVISDSELYVGSVFDLYHSTNNGETWYYINGPPDIVGIHSIERIGEGHIIIASQKGIYKNTTILDIESKSVYYNKLDDFVLSQNYPNPFNPSTKISWLSPVSSWQTLKIFNMLGIQVVTLVDEYRNAGSYEVEFDGSNLPSGVYFYQLKAGNYIEAKKMIYLK